MNPEDLVVISHRPRIESELGPLMSNVPDNKPLRPRLCPPRCLARQSRFAVLDVTTLFPSEDTTTVPSASLRSLLVVGFRADDQAVLAALNLGIPTYVLEDLEELCLRGFCRSLLVDASPTSGPRVQGAGLSGATSISTYGDHTLAIAP